MGWRQQQKSSHSIRTKSAKCNSLYLVWLPPCGCSGKAWGQIKRGIMHMQICGPKSVTRKAYATACYHSSAALLQHIIFLSQYFNISQILAKQQQYVLCTRWIHFSSIEEACQKCERIATWQRRKLMRCEEIMHIAMQNCKCAQGSSNNWL